MTACVSSPCSVGVESGRLGLVVMVAARQLGLSRLGQLGIVAVVAVWLLESESTSFMPEMFIKLEKYSTAELDLSGLEIFEIGSSASRV